MNMNDIELSSPRPSSASSENKKMHYLFFGMGLVLVVNCVLIGVLVIELRQAKAQATHIQTQFAPVVQSATALVSVALGVSRAIHGNVPDMVNGLIQTNYVKLGSDVSTTAQKVQNVFDTGDADLLGVAQYSALVRSISNQIKLLNPSFTSPAIPDPDGDSGVLDILTYITSWADLQVNVTSLSALGQSCDIMIDAMVGTDWSGYYSWGDGRYSSTWNANNIKDTLTQIQRYCRRAEKMSLSKKEKDQPTPVSLPISQ